MVILRIVKVAKSVNRADCESFSQLAKINWGQLAAYFCKPIYVSHHVSLLLLQSRVS